MKTVSRNGFFETNSSSVHTVVISGCDYKMSGDLDFRDGVLTIQCGDFCKDQTVSGQKRKLEYVATMICVAGRCDGLDGLDRVSTDDDESPWMLNDLFCTLNKNFPQIAEVVIENIGGAEMDIRYARFDSDVVNVSDERSLTGFLFNDSVSVEIWKD